VDRQKEYFDLTGRYAQMFDSHLGGPIPADGAHQLPSGWYAHPTDQQYSWNDLNAIQYEPLPVAIVINQYAGPEGPGFVTCFRMGIGGAIWQRCRNYGGEALRASDWAPMGAGQ
jgi:hypothetical protein